MLEIEEEFKYRLEKALSIRGMKAIDLVNKTGISESAISQYRKGLTKPKHDRLVKIADALSVNPSWLLGLDVPMEVEVSLDNHDLLIYQDDIQCVIETKPMTNKAEIQRIHESTQRYLEIIKCLNQLNESSKEDLLKYAKYLTFNKDNLKE